MKIKQSHLFNSLCLIHLCIWCSAYFFSNKGPHLFVTNIHVRKTDLFLCLSCFVSEKRFQFLLLRLPPASQRSHPVSTAQTFWSTHLQTVRTFLFKVGMWRMWCKPELMEQEFFSSAFSCALFQYFPTLSPNRRQDKLDPTCLPPPY